MIIINMSCNNVKANKTNMSFKRVRPVKHFKEETVLNTNKTSLKNTANKRLLALRKNITEERKRKNYQPKTEGTKNSSLGAKHRNSDEVERPSKKYKFNSTEDHIQYSKQPIYNTSEKVTLPISDTYSNSDNSILPKHTIIKLKSTEKSSLHQSELYSTSDNTHSNNDEIFETAKNVGSSMEDTVMEWDKIDIELEITDNSEQENICIAADTNVFLHYLHKIKDILNFQASVTELDFIKHESKNIIKTSAIKAIEFINTHLENNPKVIGQSVEAAIKQKDVGKDPDDKILASCLQISKKFKTLILLSNDCNLRNKALMSNLEVSSTQNIMQKLLFKTRKNTKSSKIIHKLSTLCTQIIINCCKEAYGDIWNKMDMLENPPWSFLDCLKRITRYWKSIFKELLLKQCLPKVIVLQKTLETNSGFISDDSETFNEFIKKVLEFLIFLKDIPSEKSQVNACIEEIISIAN
ncbi:swt1 RNA endoribonuclease isoform X2 [Rhynchophorus ferrugineus]|uniref:swt1 RNA endoribonuclease isoform X2 n=1 Tax=Rhynchophorus ferrugineus TaxID=354439 RepID=UPI003FCCBD8F